MSDLPPINSIVPAVVAIIVLIGSIVMFIGFRAQKLYPRYVAVAFSVEAIITILVSLGSILGVNNITLFYRESIEEVTTAAKENEKMFQQIIDVAEDVNEEIPASTSEATSASASNVEIVSSFTKRMKGISEKIEKLHR